MSIKTRSVIPGLYTILSVIALSTIPTILEYGLLLSCSEAIFTAHKRRVVNTALTYRLLPVIASHDSLPGVSKADISACFRNARTEYALPYFTGLKTEHDTLPAHYLRTQFLRLDDSTLHHIFQTYHLDYSK